MKIVWLPMCLCLLYEYTTGVLLCHRWEKGRNFHLWTIGSEKGKKIVTKSFGYTLLDYWIYIKEYNIVFQFAAKRRLR